MRFDLRFRFASLTALVASLLFSTLSCTPVAGNGKLHGSTRPIAKQVGGARMTEVRAQEPDTVFTFRAAPGHLLFTLFGFTHCPDLCPTTLGDLRRALRKLGSGADRVDVSFITVDPGRDSAEVLTRYLSSFFLKSHALRPIANAELLAVQAAFGATSAVTRRADGDFDVAHTAASYVVDEHGRVLVEWDFGTTPADMAADLKTLLQQIDRGPASEQGGVEVLDPYARPSPNGVTVGAIYAVFRSSELDTLVSVSVPVSVANRAEPHAIVKNTAGQMEMAPLTLLPLPAGQAVEFKPGGRHIMLFALARPLVAGQSFPLTLVFSRSGKKSIQIPIRGD